MTIKPRPPDPREEKIRVLAEWLRESGLSDDRAQDVARGLAESASSADERQGNTIVKLLGELYALKRQGRAKAKT